MSKEKHAVRLIRLVTGEEIVGLLVHSDEHSVSLEKVLALVTNFDPNTKTITPTLFPWAPHVAGVRITIAHDKTIYNEIPNDDLADAYLKATGERRIEAPPKGLVLPK